MSTGTISARVFTSNAEIPIQNAGVGVTERTDTGNRLVGYRFTDENGKTESITIETPEAELSRVPGNGTPYSIVDVKVVHPAYETIVIENVQIFPGVDTIQTAQMIPIGESPLLIEESEIFDVTSQNL